MLARLQIDNIFAFLVDIDCVCAVIFIHDFHLGVGQWASVLSSDRTLQLHAIQTPRKTVQDLLALCIARKPPPHCAIRTNSQSDIIARRTHRRIHTVDRATPDWEHPDRVACLLFGDKTRGVNVISAVPAGTTIGREKQEIAIYDRRRLVAGTVDATSQILRILPLTVFPFTVPEVSPTKTQRAIGCKHHHTPVGREDRMLYSERETTRLHTPNAILARLLFIMLKEVAVPLRIVSVQIEPSRPVMTDGIRHSRIRFKQDRVHLRETGNAVCQRRRKQLAACRKMQAPISIHHLVGL